MRISTLGTWNEKTRHKVAKGQRHKGRIENSVPLCLCASVPDEKGFTLIELSLVILLIGMILSLVLPNIGIHKSKLEKEREIEKISQTIKSLYDLSQVQNKEITLSFDLDENKFQAVSLIDGEEEYVLPEKRLISALKIKDIVNFEGNKITKGTVSLTFSPAGFVESATIHFIDKDSKFYTLSINPLTGQSRFEEGYREKE